jgi:hypothetical protein
MPAKPPRTTHSIRRVRREAEEIWGGGQISCDVSESICRASVLIPKFARVSRTLRSEWGSKGDYVKHLTIFGREACAEVAQNPWGKIVVRESVRYRAEALTRNRHTP